MSGTERLRLVIVLVLAAAVFVGATEQAIRAGVDGLRNQRFLALRDAWETEGSYYNPLSSTAVVVCADGRVVDSKLGGVPLDAFYEQALERFGGAS